ncbi:DUF5004 domain-containing protein [Sphingobacterium sp. InxBP1]|uniref:DUF5004 domain-containing protein n=1 Tax=Sphingobacterium sp. InxBP1 TaxID=2870328 RepID=UPI002243F6E2|nr:DUF5004 domain-containing protein [Sphingobacterium sp. InxBP1]MCW8310137.1 DUF5004 domain-containing protein [Sphingobacterium sp. InxBP1]
MMKKNTIRLLPMLMLLCAGLQSCTDELAKIPAEEPAKDITGDWKVIQLTRNGEDLGSRMLLDHFRISFKADGTYAVADQLPFVVRGSGTYRLEDPQYPFHIVLRPADGQENVLLKFQFPIVKGRRQLSLSMSLGCAGNSYQYDLERQDPAD